MSKSRLITKFLKIVIHSIPFFIMAMIGVPIMGMTFTEISKVMGLRTIPVEVVGTGSMYPSLFWSKAEGGPEDEQKKVIEEYRTTPHLYRKFEGITISSRTIFHRDIGYGDMVAFKNNRTESILQAEGKDTSSGFIKRVIGVPGDTIELRDGFVYKNNELLSEPYINSPRSTYGGSIIKDCAKVTVPEGKYLVLGDNRKVSSDSRNELGLISGQDIMFVLPYNEQKIYKSLWRDTAGDNKLLGQPTLLVNEFVELVNKERANKNIGKLRENRKLIESSTARGEHLLIDAKTDYDMKSSISNVGYSNIVLGEFVSRGHYSAAELLSNLLFNPATAKQITNKDYSDIGLSDVNREIDGCPTQIIVGHLGGYIPATYEPAVVESWRELRDNLHSALTSWEQAVGYDIINQTKLNQLLTILRARLSLSEEILGTMEKKEWLSDDQQARIKADDATAKTAETLTKELNKE